VNVIVMFADHVGVRSTGVTASPVYNFGMICG